MIILIINFFFLILLSLSQNLRIHLQIDGSFHNYLLALKIEEKISKNKMYENNSEFSSQLNINDMNEQINNKKEKKNKSNLIDLKNKKNNDIEIIIDNNRMSNNLVKNEQK